MALGTDNEQPETVEPGEDTELLAEIEALKARNAELEARNEELGEAVTALEKSGKGKPAPVKLEKPGKFYTKTFKLSDPYSERVFFPDPARATEVRPMTSWVDCQIKAGVLIRDKG